MIKQLGAMVISAALMAPLPAQAEGAYVGINAGRAQQKLTVFEDGTYKDSATAYKLYAGYELNRYFGLQGGYVDMGKAKSIYDADDIQGNLNAKTKSFYIAATASLPVNDQFSVFAKLGVSRNRVKLIDNYVDAGTEGHESESETRTTPLIGIGAAYHFSKSLAVVAEYEDFGKVLKVEDGNLKAKLFSVGLRYKF